MQNKEIKRGEIVIYQSPDKKIKIEVSLDDETVWLTQKQIAKLFGRGIPDINEHTKKIYKDKELSEVLTIRKFRIVQKEGRRTVAFSGRKSGAFALFCYQRPPVY